MTEEKQANTPAETISEVDNNNTKPVANDQAVKENVEKAVEEKNEIKPEVEEDTTKEKTKEEKFDPTSLNLKPGLTIKVHQTIRETNAKGELKERVQVFEGRIIALKHGTEIGSTITVRKISNGFGVEKIFPIFSPNIAKIEIVREARVRRSKLYFLRNYKKRLTEKLFKQ